MTFRMTLRTRKFIGTLAIPLWIAIYALIVMAVGGRFVVGSGLPLELLFYVVAGIGWLPVAMWIITWMSQQDQK